MSFVHMLTAELGNWPDANMVWAMVHTLWQGAIVAGLLWMFLRLLPVRFARLRYSAALACLFALPILGMVTWSVLDHGGWTWPRTEHMGLGIDSPHVAAAPQENSSIHAPGGTPFDWKLWAGRIWMFGAIFMSLRAAARTALVQQKITKIPPLSDGEVFEQVNRLCLRMGIRRRIKIVVWDQLRVPAVAGFFFPILLLSAEIVLQCPPGQLQMILAHELAHVRRWDFLINFVQQILEAILFFNPALWWMSRQVRFEREACCDALAVALTGQPVLAVRTLAAYAQAVSDVPMPAMSGVSGSMLDRIRRILRPQDRARVAAPWYAAMAGLVCAVLLLCALRVGADVVVAATQKFLTPDEVKQLDQMQQAQNPEPSTARTVVLRGLVRTADGSALPQGIGVSIDDRLGNNTTGLWAHVDETSHFRQSLQAGELQFAVDAPGFAPAFLGPIRPGQDGTYLPITFVLQRGFDARLLIVDGAGNPLPHVHVNISYQHTFIIANQKLTTDDHGAVVVHHASPDFPTSIEINRIGFEYQKTELKLRGDQDNRLALAPEETATGTVIDAQSGARISGATIKQMWRNGFQPQVSWSGEAPLLATTDESGHFVLHSLRGDSDYGVLVSASGHQCEIYREIRAGDSNLKWKLGPPRVIRGRVTGDLSRLRGNYSNLPANSYAIFVGSTLFAQPNSSYAWSTPAPVHVSDGVGTFEIDDPFPGRLTLTAAGNSINLNPGDIPALVELHVDADSAHPKVAKRTVILKFDLPPGAPPPAGKLRVDYNELLFEVPVRNGEASLEVSVPGQIMYSEDELIGCYLTNGVNVMTDVPAGSTPLVISIPAIPAGAVHGRVTGPDGNPPASFAVSPIEIVRSPLTPQNMGLSLQPFNSNGGSGDYLLGDLPLGGRYRLLAWSGDSYALSNEINFAGKSPLSEVNFHLALGQSVRVKVTDADGKPRAGAAFSLMFTTRNSRFSGPNHTTGRDGTAQIEHVNPAIDGDYTIQIQPGADYPGLQEPIKIDGKLVALRLARGVALKGTILDDTNGKPLGQHRMRVTALDGAGTSVETTTDDEGHFDYENLAAVDYQLSVDASAPVGSQPMRGPNGRINGWQYPNDWRPILVHGGQTTPLVVRVIPMP